MRPFFLTLFALSLPSIAAAEISYNFQIRPILSRHCISCHGPDEGDRQADFRIDTAEGAQADLGDYAGIVPGSPDKSEAIARILASDESERMPPAEHAEPLAPEEIALLKQWITEGAHYETHWSFVPPKKTLPLKNENPDWAQNEIDIFIASKHNEQKLLASPPASPYVLIRRVALALTGLPPTPNMVEQFAAQPSDEAYEAVVDQLLASPSYGEHWAAIWLDLARYADTTGYAGDEERPIWPWKDWVIQALNSNMPYDQFTIEQIAGDLLPDATESQRLATAFHRNTLTNSEGGTSNEEFRTIAVKDRIGTTMNVWMGLTLRCAECHSHKFDPISQTEYYAFLDFFNQTVDNDEPDDRPHLEVLLKEHKTQQKNDKQKPEQNKTISVPILQELDADSRRKTHLMTRGNYLQLGEPVTAAVPTAFHPLPPDAPVNRLGVARWLVSPDNPLTARVAVNRYWARLFGLGIVETEENFGTQGTLPSHPELLDWLAVEFQTGGWDTKALLKKIVLSSTFRQASAATQDQLEKDPRNVYHTRGPRFRLSAEAVRDQALAVSGLLSNKQFGPPVYPPSPIKKVVAAFTEGKVWEESQGEDRYRRAIYTYLQRSRPHPLFETFDMATREVCNLRRFRTNTPLQSFMTLNDIMFIEAAQALAKNMIEHGNLRTQIEYGLQRALLRPPTSKQVDALVKLYDRSYDHYLTQPDLAAKMAGVPAKETDTQQQTAELASLTVVANVIMNLDGFLNL